MSNDPHAAFRAQMQEEGRRTLARIAREEQAAVANRAQDQITTIEDVDSIVWARQQTAIANDLAEKQKRILDLQNESVPSESRNKFAYLTQDEILTLDRLERQKASQQAEMEKQFVSAGQWCLNNRSFPASPEALKIMVDRLRGQGLSLTHGNMDAAWASLQGDGSLRPDFSQRNHAAHDANVEELRAAGLNIQPAPDPRTASPDELEAFLRSQPPPTVANLQPDTSVSAWDYPLEREVPYGQQVLSDLYDR